MNARTFRVLPGSGRIHPGAVLGFLVHVPAVHEFHSSRSKSNFRFAAVQRTQGHTDGFCSLVRSRPSFAYGGAEGDQETLKDYGWRPVSVDVSQPDVTLRMCYGDKSSYIQSTFQARSWSINALKPRTRNTTSARTAPRGCSLCQASCIGVPALRFHQFLHGEANFPEHSFTLIQLFI